MDALNFDRLSMYKSSVVVAPSLLASHAAIYHGEPNLFLPDIVAAGESLYGDPFALVATPPGSV
jgi:hypothetical protein